jgi:predicted MFS family arabinose efflux permease
MAARVLAALTSAVYTPQVAATVSMLVSDRERGPALARLMMGWAIGSVVGGPLVVLIGTTFGWRVSMGAIAVASGIVAVLIGRAVPADVKVPALNWQRWIRVIRSPALMLLTAATGLNTLGHSLVFSYIAPIMKALHDVSGATLASLYFASGTGGLAGNIASGRLIQRRGAARVAFASGLITATAFALWPFISHWLPAIFAVQLFWAFGSGTFPAAQQTRLVAVDPSLAAATIAMNSSVSYLGISLGSTLGATAWIVVGPRYMPWVGLLFMLASFVCSKLGERAVRELPAAASD